MHTDLLGKRWHNRVVNVNGDFSYAILETIRFYLIQPRPLLDIDFKRQNVTDELELVPFYSEQQKAIVFMFVTLYIHYSFLFRSVVLRFLTHNA